ncbi:contact-dependent growth inhibition system immunity protein [Nocardia sp. NPDC052566]|uniref:contact-dependent growth inhibition system immunity protein n=1 Tax=Nocardia sp. NPDC052566 TaxID=3364330 RepID=UPI0037C8F807
MCVPSDEQLILRLIQAFSVAVERGLPHEIAALMCADEAEAFLDDIADLDGDEPVDPIEEPAIAVALVRVFGDLAMAYVTHPGGVEGQLFFRREERRWTVCADAEDELSLEQLEDNVWPAVPAEVSGLVWTVHELRRKPCGSLSIEDLRLLLRQGEGVGVLLPRASNQLQWNPLAEGDFFPGDLLVATLQLGREHWARDPVSLTRIRIAIDRLAELGDLTTHGAPHHQIWSEISRFQQLDSTRR